jgi:hypothetical protein
MTAVLGEGAGLSATPGGVTSSVPSIRVIAVPAGSMLFTAPLTIFSGCCSAAALSRRVGDEAAEMIRIAMTVLTGLMLFTPVRVVSTRAGAASDLPATCGAECLASPARPSRGVRRAG